MGFNQSLSQFVNEQVQNGSCSSVENAEEQISARLYEKELDRKIARGRADIKAGRYTTLTDESIQNMVSNITSKLSAKQKE